MWEKVVHTIDTINTTPEYFKTTKLRQLTCSTLFYRSLEKKGFCWKTKRFLPERCRSSEAQTRERLFGFCWRTQGGGEIYPFCCEGLPEPFPTGESHPVQGIANSFQLHCRSFLVRTKSGIPHLPPLFLVRPLWKAKLQDSTAKPAMSAEVFAAILSARKAKSQGIVTLERSSAFSEERLGLCTVIFFSPKEIS